MSLLTTLDRRLGHRPRTRDHDDEGSEGYYELDYGAHDYDDEWDEPAARVERDARRSRRSRRRPPADPSVDGTSARGSRSEDGIDPRIAARRHAVRSARSLRNRRIALVVASVATILATLYGVTRSALLDVDTITVTGSTHASPAEVVARSGLHVGDHLVGLDPDAAAAQIRQLPWVRDVTVTRNWRGTIDLAIEERSPAAAVHLGAAGWLVVDSDRRVLAAAPAAATPPAGLPAIEGVAGAAVGDTLDPSAQGAITVARAISPGLRTRVTAVDGQDPTSLVLDVLPATKVRFGTADQLEQKIRSLQAVYAQADLTNLCAIDMRVPDAPVLTRC
jgi:cell division protein FtsQ